MKMLTLAPPLHLVLRSDRLAKPLPSVRLRSASEGGFTLVELMVSLVLALLILAGLITMFANTSAARSEIDKASRQIENGRYALQVLSDEVRHAGYFGPLAVAPAPGIAPVSPTATLTWPNDPCLTTTQAAIDGMVVPVQGYAGAATDPTPTTCLPGYKPNTAVLVVRRADTATPPPSFQSTEFNIQVSGCDGDVQPFIVAVAANAASAASLFTAHAKDTPTSSCTPVSSAPSAPVTPLFIRIYYIASCSNQNNCSGGDGVPTLKRLDVKPGGAVVTPIVDGIENLQIEYGLDTSVDGSTDSYTATPPATIANWQNVVALRLHVLARNNDPTGGYTDGKTYVLGPVSVTPSGADAPYKRHAYTELVRVNNVAGRRE
jgi:type IV pilus assembly protein PilW